MFICMTSFAGFMLCGTPFSTCTLLKHYHSFLQNFISLQVIIVLIIKPLEITKKWAKDLKRHFPREDIQWPINTGKYTQMPLVTGEKTTMSYHLHPH